MQTFKILCQKSNIQKGKKRARGAAEGKKGTGEEEAHPIAGTEKNLPQGAAGDPPLKIVKGEPPKTK